MNQSHSTFFLSLFIAHFEDVVMIFCCLKPAQICFAFFLGFVQFVDAVSRGPVPCQFILDIVNAKMVHGLFASELSAILIDLFAKVY